MNTQTLIAATDNVIAEIGHDLDSAMFDARAGKAKSALDSLRAARNRLQETIDVLVNLNEPG